MLYFRNSFIFETQYSTYLEVVNGLLNYEKLGTQKSASDGTDHEHRGTHLCGATNKHRQQQLAQQVILYGPS